MCPTSGGGAAGAPPAASSQSWAVTKHSWWRGAYSRRLSICNGWLLTSDPATGRTTNAWRLADVLAVERRPGAALELKLAGCCAPGCGGPTLHLSLPSPPAASALHASLARTVLRHVAAEATAGNLELAGSVLDARPCELPPTCAQSTAETPGATPARASPMGSPVASPPSPLGSAPASPKVSRGGASRGCAPECQPPSQLRPLVYRASGLTRGEGSRDEDDATSICSDDTVGPLAARTRHDPELTFEVHVSVQKARNLRAPPPFAAPPRVVVSWGAPPHTTQPPQLAPPPPWRSWSIDSAAAPPSSAVGSCSREGGGRSGVWWTSTSYLLGASSGARPGAEAYDDALLAAAGARRPVYFETPPGEEDPSAPRWGVGASFEYAATLTQLGSAVLRLELVHPRVAPLSPSPIGACEVRLADIASGPIKYDLPVLDGLGMPCGRLVFTVRMLQKCMLAVTIPWAKATMRSLQRHTSEASQKASHRDADFTLTAALTMDSDECEPMRVDFDSASMKLLDGAQVQVHYHESATAPRAAIEAEASASAFANESLHLEVLLSSRAAANAASATVQRSPSLDSLGGSMDGSSYGLGSRRGGQREKQERLRGEVWLPMTKVYTPGDKRHAVTEFDEVLWKNGQRVGRLSGCVAVHHGPRVVQLPGGFFTEHGIVPVGPVAFDKSNQRARDESPVDARLSAFLEGDKKPAGAELAPRCASSGSGEAPLVKPPPKGTCLPKQVEALVALMAGLKQVILELHTTRADEPLSPEAPGDSPESPLPGDAEGVELLHDEAEDDFQDHPDAAGRAGAWARSRGGASEIAARRLGMLCQRMQVLLSSSHKESVRSFFYPSPEGLTYTQLLLIRLWAHLLKQVDHLPHRHQCHLFATLTPLTLRGELSPSALYAAPASLIERYVHVLWETVGYVTAKLNRKAATSEVRVFCSHALSIAFFRLPPLRPVLIGIILPPGENRFKHVREWNLPWSLQKAALRDGGGERASTPSHHKDFVASGGAPRRVISAEGHRYSSERASRSSGHLSHGEPLDAWAMLWLSHAHAVPHAAMERALSGKYWRERLRKRGHCFFMLLEHWARHAAVAMGTQPDECTNWKVVPGYAALVKAFLLEMRQRPVHLWPESMRACLAALVQANRPLTQVFARILVSAASGTSLRRTLTALQRLSELMTLSADEALAAMQQGLPLHASPGAIGLSSSGAFGSFGGGGGGFGSSGAFGGRDSAEGHAYELALHQIKYLLASHHFKVVGCALIFLYNHLDRLGEELRLEVLSWLHDSMFGTLALHWSRVVRSSFMHIVVLKVQHIAEPPSPAGVSKYRRVERTSSLEGTHHVPDFLAPLTLRAIGSSRSVPSGMHLGQRLDGPGSGSDDHLLSDRRGFAPPSRTDSILSSPSATKLSKLALHDAESSMLQAAFGESLRYVQALAESSDGSAAAVDAAEQLGLGLAGEAAGAADTVATWQSYARHAWAEHNALQRKWDEMQEMQSRYPDAADEGAHGRRANGHHHSGGRHGAPQRRQQLTLSMAGLCESSEDDDDEVSHDEW